MADTAVETVLGIIEQQGGTSTARTLVPALVDLGEIIAGGGGGTIEDGSVTTAKLADEAVTTAKIADGAVTADKIAEGVIPSGGGSQTSWYGTCSTAAATAAKAVTCEGFELADGAIVTVYFSTASTANSPTLNVNDTGAIEIYLYDSKAAGANPLKWSAKSVITFAYIGSKWVVVDKPSIYYLTCTTTASSGEKTTETVAGVVVMKGTVVSVRFASENTYTSGALTLIVSDTGSATIQRYGSNTSSSNQMTWDSTSVLTFVRVGTAWSFIGGELAATS